MEDQQSIDRNNLLVKLEGVFLNRLEKALESYTADEKIELTESVLAMIKFFKENDKPGNFEKFSESDKALKLKYRSRLKPFLEENLDLMLDPQHCIYASKLFLPEEYNLLQDQFLTDKEYQNYLQRLLWFVKNYLGHLYISPIEGMDTVSLSGKGKEITLRKQALAMCFLFEYLGINDNGQGTAKANFIKFLTGGSYDNIYKVVQNPRKVGDGEKARKHYISELKFIKEYFEKLEFDGVVTILDNEIDQNR